MDKSVALKSRQYAQFLIWLVSRKVQVHAIMSANLDYWQDAGFKDVCASENIPFVVLSREHPIVPEVCDIVSKRYADARYRFKGTKIAVAGQSSKDVICKRSNVCSEYDVIVTGLPRFDAWFDVDTTRPKSNRPNITLLTFTRGYFADETFKEVLDIFCRSASTLSSESVRFLVKTKDCEDTLAVKMIIKERGLYNVEVDHARDLFDILPESKLVLGYNSLSLVEAVMANAEVVVPAWGQCRSSGDNVMYSEDNANVANVLSFAKNPVEMYDFIDLAIKGSFRGVDQEELDRFVGRYIYRPARGSSCEVSKLVNEVIVANKVADRRAISQ